uniref:Uncharacterized protein n=1 Tax=Marmota marmota marmota TaxID=9994 RepID=A0A8C6AAG6_MARMA
MIIEVVPDEIANKPGTPTCIPLIMKLIFEKSINSKAVTERQLNYHHQSLQVMFFHSLPLELHQRPEQYLKVVLLHQI